VELKVKVKEIQRLFSLEVVAGKKGVDREITAGYCGDLLSDVMANAVQGAIWLTIQGHQNIVAVAALKDLAGIVLVNGHSPDENAKAKAEDEGIPILLSSLSTYELAGQLYEAGIGKKEG
jgi:predicted transcriptional regulator